MEKILTDNDLENLGLLEKMKFVRNERINELFVLIAGDQILDNDERYYYFSALLPLNIVQTQINLAGWDLRKGELVPDFYPDGQGNYIYRYSNQKGIEQIAVFRTFDNETQKSTYELTEEFRLLFNLFFDYQKKIYYFIDDAGKTVEAGKIIGNCIYVRKDLLIRYACCKQMAISLYFDLFFGNKNHGNSTFLGSVKTDCFYAHIHVVFENEEKSKLSFGSIIGKQIILPRSIEECGFYPYDGNEKFEEFSVGINSNGTTKYASCNPNNLEKTIISTSLKEFHYYTVIYFDKNVLNKYYTDSSKYSVGDSFVTRKGVWNFRIDNHNESIITAYLGDIGCDLPVEEQTYWKSFNILSDKGQSDLSKRRDWDGDFFDPEISDLCFKNLYLEFIPQWKSKFGWDLFLPLVADDHYCLEDLHLPFSHSQEEFDKLWGYLVKILVDSINQKILKQFVYVKECKGSINFLNQWFTEQKYIDFDKHINYLKSIQSYRSECVSHRKSSKTYSDICKKIGLVNNNYYEVFDQKLTEGIELLNDLLFLEPK